jgi:DUF917 family protein
MAAVGEAFLADERRLIFDTTALMPAAHLGIPVVDADTMGRAYPEAQMTSVAVGGLCPFIAS